MTKDQWCDRERLILDSFLDDLSIFEFDSRNEDLVIQIIDKLKSSYSILI